jgi:Phage tail lysozyme
MAIKSRINIDVESSEFEAFKSKFDKYRDALKEMPGTWHEIGQSTAVAKTNFEAIAESVKTVGTGLATITTSGREFFHVTTATARHWHDLALSTGQVAGNIVRATESLIKWTGILSLVTGGAGLFGFDRMANSVSNQRSAALGVGSSYGSRAAFLTNFRRMGDPEGMLGRISEAQADPEKSRALRVLGLSDADIGGDPADVAIKALRTGAKIASHEDERFLGIDPHLELFSLEERRRLRSHPEEIEEMAAGMQRDRKTLSLSEKDQKAYQEFTTQMERAGRQIETVFVKGLIPLEHPLENLSKEVVKLVEKLTAKGGPFGHLIDDLSDGLKWLSGEVDKPEFHKNGESFIEGIGKLVTSVGGLVHSLASWARWLGVSDAHAAVNPRSATGAGPGEVAPPGPGGSTGEGYGTHGSGHNATTGPMRDRGGSPRSHGGGRTPGSVIGSHEGNFPVHGDAGAAMRAAKDQLRLEGVPEEHLDAAAAALVGNAIAESQLNPRAVQDSGTGYGIYGARLGRNTRMQAWLAAHGYARDSLEGQQRYMAHEAMHDYPVSRRALMSATDPSVAGDILERNFESPRILNNRHSAFRRAYSAAGNQRVTITATPGGNVVTQSHAAAAGSP